MVWVKVSSRSRDGREQVDAHLVVYSVTDRASFVFAQSCLQDLRPAKRHGVVILVANKQDLVRNRVISEEGSTAQCAHDTIRRAVVTRAQKLVEASLKPNYITLAGSELAPNMFGASSELVRS